VRLAQPASPRENRHPPVGEYRRQSSELTTMKSRYSTINAEASQQ
jgi:hypothetical protein